MSVLVNRWVRSLSSAQGERSEVKAQFNPRSV